MISDLDVMAAAQKEIALARSALKASGQEPTDAAVAGYLAAALTICRHLYVTDVSAGHTRSGLRGKAKEKPS